MYIWRTLWHTIMTIPCIKGVRNGMSGTITIGNQVKNCGKWIWKPIICNALKQETAYCYGNVV